VGAFYEVATVFGAEDLAGAEFFDLDDFSGGVVHHV
jgi:hypothetical protein